MVGDKKQGRIEPGQGKEEQWQAGAAKSRMRIYINYKRSSLLGGRQFPSKATKTIQATTAVLLRLTCLRKGLGGFVGIRQSALINRSNATIRRTRLAIETADLVGIGSLQKGFCRLFGLAFLAAAEPGFLGEELFRFRLVGFRLFLLCFRHGGHDW
jgi:hypothetical protein